MLLVRDLGRREGFLVSSNKCTIREKEDGGSSKEVSGCDRENRNAAIMSFIQTGREKRR